MNKSILFIAFFILCSCFSQVFSQQWNSNASNNTLVPYNNSNNLTPLKIGIGTENPTVQLHTTEGVRFEGIMNNNSLRRVLMQDEFGYLFWRDISTFPVSEVIKYGDTTIINNYYNGEEGNTDNWKLLGNSGTNPNINFLGTIDNNRLVFRTRNSERATILSNEPFAGYFGLNTPAPVTLFNMNDGMLRIDGGRIRKNTASNENFSLFEPTAFNGLNSGLQLQNGSDFFGIYIEQLDQYSIDQNDFVIYSGDNFGNNNTENIKFCRALWNGSVHTLYEYARIDSRGNFGLNTLQPTARLHINCSNDNLNMREIGNSIEHSNSNIRFENIPSGTGYTLVVDSDGYVYADKTGSSPQAGIIEDKNELNNLKQELQELKDQIKDLQNVIKELSLNNPYSLQNAPNPFEMTTNITYLIPSNGNVKLELFDELGSKIKVLEDEFKVSGKYTYNLNGSELSNGSYFYVLTLNNKQITKKAIKL